MLFKGLLETAGAGRKTIISVVSYFSACFKKNLKTEYGDDHIQ